MSTIWPRGRSDAAEPSRGLAIRPATPTAAQNSRPRICRLSQAARPETRIQRPEEVRPPTLAGKKLTLDDTRRPSEALLRRGFRAAGVVNLLFILMTAPPSAFPDCDKMDPAVLARTGEDF